MEPTVANESFPWTFRQSYWKEEASLLLGLLSCWDVNMGLNDPIFTPQGEELSNSDTNIKTRVRER